MTTTAAADRPPSTRRRTVRLQLLALALLAYVPALASQPGRMPADTKLYLYLDPGGLVSRAASTFEADQFAGWVPHQQIAYLWPAGPWYWLLDSAGVPDWIAHRLWIGTIMFVAGAGVRWAARLLGVGAGGSMAAALVYQLSPFLLAYISRTSLLLLPWAAVGWIVALTVRAAVGQTPADGDGTSKSSWRNRLGSWRDPALIALIVATIGAVNATALALIIPAPVLWLVHAAWQRAISWRRALAVAARVGALSAAVSLWWIGMLIVQARHGAAVLSFSESLEDVSRNSTGSEILRSLGYWLFYQRDRIGPTTTASLPYLISVRTIAISFAVVLVGLLGITVVTWNQRRYAALLVAAGAVIAVGVHPVGSPSPLMALFTDDSGSGLALALRSSTRALPVFLLGIALGAGALASAIPTWTRLRPSTSRHRSALQVVVAGAIGLLAVLNMPSLYGFGLVDPAIDRDENPPQVWLDAAERIDDTADGSRVLQLPGAEFGAFRWGYTADQPLVGLADTPLLTRDLLPLGSASAMDLLYALDDRFQDGTIEVASVAPLARLLGAETLLLTNDMAFERYRTARPEIVDDLLTSTDGVGLGTVERIGDPVVNVPDVAMIDPASLLHDQVGQAVSPLTLVAVEDPEPTIRAKTATVLVSGSGDGIVDAAAAGLVDGHELLRYTASLDGDELADAMADAEMLVVTDSNRDRAHHWRGSQDVHGHTEPGGPDDDVLVATAADQRLEVFEADPATQTVAIQQGSTTAIASSYGEPFAYRPEDRAVMAIDGDPTTAWSVGDHGDPIGERIRLEFADPLDGSHPLVLHQIVPGSGGRSITTVRLTVDDGPSIVVDLEANSYGPDGAVVLTDELEGATSLEIAIEGVSDGDPAFAASRAGVGFAEIDVGQQPTLEYIRVPIDATGQAADVPLAYVLTRLRADPDDPWRSDPEPVLRREFTLADARALDAEITLRLDLGADDVELATLLASNASDTAVADRRLGRSAHARGAAAVDGDRSTAWTTPFDQGVGAHLTVQAAEPLGELEIVQLPGDFSPISTLGISDGEMTVEVAVPPPDSAGRSTIAVPEGFGPGPITLTVTDIDERTTIDRRYGDVMTLPVAIAEIAGTGIVAAPVDGTRAIIGECVDGLVTVDGKSLALSYETTVADLIAGAPVAATPCDGALELAGGEHRIESASSSEHPLTVDRVVLTDRPTGSGPGASIATTIERADARHRTVSVDPCPDGCWLVLGEGLNDAWRATVAGDDLGPPQLVDGGFNGWWLPPSGQPTVVDLTWTAQGPVTWGLVIGAITALCLVVIVALTRRRTTAPMEPPSIVVDTVGGSRERLAAAALVISSVLLISPPWALAAVVPLAFVLIVPRRSRPQWLRRPFELSGLTVAVFVAVATMVIERRERPFPDAGWTLHFDHLNGAAVFALLALACGALFAPDAERQP